MDTGLPDGGNWEQFGSALPNLPALSPYPEAYGNRAARRASCTGLGPEGTLLAPRPACPAGATAWRAKQGSESASFRRLPRVSRRAASGGPAADTGKIRWGTACAP
jgi:hypothetical protein